MDVIVQMIQNAVSGFITGIFENAVNTFVGFMGKEMQIALTVLDSPLVKNAVALAQVIGGSLLAVKLGVEALRAYVLWQGGDPGADAGGILRRAAIGAAAIGCIPWLTKQVYVFGNSLALQISQIPSQGSADSFFEALADAVHLPFTLVITFIIALVLWLIILVQTAIRGVELGALAVCGPIMAVGLTAVNEGLFALWWRELLVLSMTQALQTLLLKGFLAQTINPQGLVGPLLMIAWLWVAVKTPNFLRQFAYHTGIGGAIGGVAQTGGTWLIVRKLMARG
ncbi:MAG: hypothetical protein H0Z39_08800 [Peptococcaceae bacterium]|nr:hypothetical protein [Peptococcaceae bacterium]